MAEPADRRYMPDNVSVVEIAAGALLIIGAIAVGFAASFFVLHVGRSEPPPEHAAHYGSPPPIEGDVRLSPVPIDDIGALRREKHQLISTYGWVDRQKGIAHIPIDRAMALLAQRAGAKAGKSP
ncbi:MAG TPA: hypothetical protein VN858_05695 [Casimicrobiaceae bacterium]|nr:hypothetical protein [Casimicrobiaceae bacterium]